MTWGSGPIRLHPGCGWLGADPRPVAPGVRAAGGRPRQNLFFTYFFGIFYVFFTFWTQPGEWK